MSGRVRIGSGVRFRAWVRIRDPGYGALRRAARAAVLMPAMFALGDKVIGNPELSYFVAFGSFAMLLLVDFQGSIGDRLWAQAALGVACAVLICLGTLASQSTAVAAMSMAVVAFAILFAGVVSSVLASATTALLLAFILPVSLSAPASSIPDRVAGWGLAAAVSLLAISLLWPAPARNPIRGRAIDASRALAARLRAEIAYVLSDDSAADREAYRTAVAAADEAIEALQALFFATPYRPTGLTTDARAVVRLVDELRWLSAVALHSAPKHHPKSPSRDVCSVKVAAADVLEQAAALLASLGIPAVSCTAQLIGCAMHLSRSSTRLRAGFRTTTRPRPTPVGPPARSSPPSTRASEPRSSASSSARSPPTPTTPQLRRAAAGCKGPSAVSLRDSAGRCRPRKSALEHT